MPVRARVLFVSADNLQYSQVQLAYLSVISCFHLEVTLFAWSYTEIYIF